MKNFVLMGEMAAGKDAVAEFMRGYLRKAFGDEIRVAARLLRVEGVKAAYCYLCKQFDQKPPRDLAKMLHEFREIPQDNLKDRQLLQELGTYCRKNKDLIWVNSVLDGISKDNKYVITDCRRQSEFEACKAKGFVAIYVYANDEIRAERLIARDGKFDPTWFDHPAEQEIRDLMPQADYILFNNGTMEELAASIELILEQEGVL